MKDNWFNRTFRSYTPNLPIESLRTVSLSDLHKISHYGTQDSYDNAYSSVRAIADQFLQIPVHAVDNNGKKIDPTPNAVKRISIPNTEQDGISFKDTLATRTQVFDKVYVLVHEVVGSNTRPASEMVSEERIAGYTFLDGVVEDTDESNRIVYKVWLGTEEHRYYPYQVMTFYDVNPEAVGKGYSPNRAAKRWSRIEDYIADYQAGFFENGAVPAGQFLVTAPTTTEFDDIVDNLEKKHKGAGANNNVVYTYQPIDPNSGKPSQAAITWVPFNTTNKDLSLKDILEATGAKTDSVYRVSAMQRAITDAPNFATAQVDDRNFIEKTIRPFTLKKWQRFQHELNRITGGLGYGISYVLETPHISEEEKAKAETSKIIWETIKDMIDSGFTYDSACDALKLPPNWKLLVAGDSKETTIENEKTDVAEDDDIDDLPKPQSGAANRTNPKAEYDVADLEGLLKPYEAQISEVLIRKMQEQVVTSSGISMQEDDSMAEEITAILIALMALRGSQTRLDVITMASDAGIPVDSIPEYAPELSDSQRQQILDYVKEYNQETEADLAAIKENNAPDVATALIAGYIAAHMWRVERWSGNEAWTFSEISSDQATKLVEDRIGGYFIKEWLVEPKACPLCLPLSGETVRMGQKFSNGLEYPPVHVNCRCTIHRTVVRIDAQASIREMHCSECDRYLGETDSDTFTGKLKCSNSKCKALEAPVIK